MSFTQPLSQGARLVPDGYFEIETPEGIRSMFLEVDQETETLRSWDRKVREYLHLAISGEFERLFSRSRFRVLVVAHTDNRLERIRASVARTIDRIFWFTTFESINRESFWSPIWLRPRGVQRHSLL